MTNVLGVIGLFLIFPCLILASIYYTIKMMIYRKKNIDNYKNTPIYEKMKSRRGSVIYTLPVVFIFSIVLLLTGGNEIAKEKINARVESYSGIDKEFYETKFSEFKKAMNDDDARKKAVEFTDKNIEYNKQIDGLNTEDKLLFDEKFASYKEMTDEYSAKEKALNDVDAEKKRRIKESEEQYKAEREAEELKRQELQKKYDDQAKYEEWIAWQKREEEKKAAAELQKKYDDQAKYEEWIAWQKSEEEKKEAEKNKKRAGLNRLERNGQIQYINLGNDTYNIIITESANFNYSKKDLTDLINYASQSEHERNIVSTAKQCMELVQVVKEAEVNVNNFTINLTGDVVDAEGYKRIDNVVICEISGNAKFVHNDPYSFYNNCSRYWMIRGL